MTQHSLWLLPAPEVEQAWRQLIDQIAARTGTTPFAPHVTLLGDLDGDPAESLKICAELFAGRPVLNAQVTGPARTEAFFMSLFLDLSLSDPLATLRAQIATRLNRPPPAAFRPHLSLGYGAASAVFPDAEIIDFIAVKQLQKFSLDRVATVCSSKTIPIEDWAVLDHLPLA